MSKLPKILLLLVLMGMLATSQVQRPGGVRPAPVLGNPGPAIGSQDELQQYTAGGHILGFRKGEMFVASGDHALKMEFVNANSVSPIGEGGSANPKQGHDAAPPLGRVTYRDLWDGVTLVYENYGSGVVKSTYRIEAGGTTAVDPVDEIRLRYNVPVKVDAVGDLRMSFATGEMRESPPVAWQEIEGKRVPVDATYRLFSEQEVGFKAGSYDPRYPLVIDPALSWNTFLGGSDYHHGYGITVDTAGNVFVAGDSYGTWSSPVRPYAGSYDAFVAKLNGSGALQWNTFLGSANDDYGYAITVDSSGNAYVTGYSDGTWGSPVHPFTGISDAFVAKLNGSGALQWNTFLGSASGDSGNGIAVDTSGNVYVAGDSYATWGSPVRPFTGSGYYDAFAAKLNGSGALQWNTFLGGSGDDRGRGIAVDTGGNVYVAGYSYATWGSPVRSYAGGASDAFAAKLNGSGTLQWNTFLGSSGYDCGFGIAVDTSGNIYVTGYSGATWGSPVRPYSGTYDAFAAKLSGSGALQWNTFLGLLNDDHGYGIAVDTSGSIYVTGDSGATWGSPVRPFAGGNDAFAAKLNGSGALQWNTFLGGSSSERGCGIALDTSGNVYIAGYGGATWGSPIRPYTGEIDTFVAKLFNSNMKNDFNGDGQDDILWRYYGSGGYNAVWFLGSSQAAGSEPLPMLASPLEAGPRSRFSGSKLIYPDARDASLGGKEGFSLKDPREFGGKIDTNVPLLTDPRDARGVNSQKDIVFLKPSFIDPRHIQYALPKTSSNNIRASGVSILGGASLPSVSDLNWQIQGTGDFNGDGKVDILWRYNGSGGYNAVWYMNGATLTGAASLPSVSDLNWQIQGTGDFNGDGKVDILWRYNGSGGANAVWYMNGATLTGGASLPSVSDLNWQIVGTGDFNADGQVDILWRYNGSGGANAVWYMNGATLAGAASLPSVSDLNWQIVGTGDFNGDGQADILWRYNGSGGYNTIWLMNGTTLTGGADVPSLADLIWKIVNR
jgi:hypothetical protein